MIKRYLSILLLGLLALTTFAQKPKLIVGIVIDQMRWDYLGRYHDRFGQNGFNRLLNEGFSYDNTQISYIPSVTAAGHSSIYTGSIPALTGIAGNNFYISGKKTYCTDDHSVSTVGADGKAGEMSPRNLRVTTIGDELRIATDYQSKVIGISLKDRGAILPAGHASNAAYWYDKDAGVFISSTYYMQQLPSWVKQFNEKNRQTVDIRYTPMGNTLVADLAIAAIDNEKLGKGKTTDMLCVSFSSTDYVGHRYSTRGKEIDETYLSLDKDLGRLFSHLDSKVGRGNYLVFLTADHAAAHNYLQMQKHGAPAGIFDEEAAKKVNGVKDVIENRIYLSDPEDKATKEAIMRHFSKDKAVYRVVDFSNLDGSLSLIPDWLRTKIVNGYDLQRSGDILLILRPGYYQFKSESYKNGTDHGSAWRYDSHIPFLLMGTGIKHGRSNKAVSVSDIAPTICSLLGIQEPSGCVGNAVNE